LADGPNGAPKQLTEPALPDERPAAARDWRSLWQVPAILGSLALIAAGLYVMRPPAEVITIEEFLATAEQRMGEGRLDEARLLLKDHVEPMLTPDDLPGRAHFHVLVADWLALQKASRGTSIPQEDAVIIDQYRLGRDLGFPLDPPRMERFAAAYIATGRFVEARGLLADLDQVSADDPEYAARRSRLLRQKAAAMLESDDPMPAAERLAMLDQFRRQAASSPDDHAWALLQESAIRIEEGDPDEAIARLLIGMRRLEGMHPPVGPELLGELYLLLGQAHLYAGRYDEALFHADIAGRTLPPGHALGPSARVIRAETAIARGAFEDALEDLGPIVEDGRGTPAWARALMLRGDVRGILGDRDGALEDFRRLQSHLGGRDAVDGVRAVDAASLLVDRHDGSLLSGDLEAGLAYLDAAHAFFSMQNVPEIVLERAAATRKAHADHIVARAIDAAGAGARWDDVSPEQRRIAMHEYERAAAAFERLARARQTSTEDAGAWAESLRLAGTSHDRAGRPDRAALRYREYLEQYRVDRDPERSMVQFKLGRALIAEQRFDEAITVLEKVIEEDPNIVGTIAHVPLARARIAAGRLDEAIRGLDRVVEGRGVESDPLTPEADDYHTALIELGEILHESGRRAEDPEERRRHLVQAIERLTAARDRRPGDERVIELVYRMGDAHRLLADLEDAWLTETVSASPVERRRRMEAAAQHRHAAIALLAEVATALSDLSPRRLTPFQREMQRGAWMGRAGSLYALGEYDAAVRLYDRAARMFGDDPDSIAAMIQVVNCYDRMGRPDLADAAHRAALDRISAMPEHVFTGPRALFSRRAWEEWMAHRPVGLAIAREDLP